MIQLGESKIALAGGMESMSQAPHVIRGMRWGVGLGEGKLEDSLMVTLLDTYCGLYMATTAELYAGQQGITREMQDEFALRSQKCADDAYKAGRLQEELTPVALRNRKGEPTGEMFTEDDLRRPETTIDSLRKLKPAFGTGSVTAGNASGIVDGGAAVVVMPLDEAVKRNVKPMARIVSWGIAGVDPRIMGSGPVPATRIALNKAGLKLDDIDLIEVNEAFAAQYLAVEKELGLDRNKVNVNGGAHRARPSAGRNRHAPADYADERTASPQGQVWTVHRVHRRRTGHRGDPREPAAVRAGTFHENQRLV